MNEADFVAFLQDNFPFSFGKGIGDDTSVVKNHASFQLITKDLLIENIHFKLQYFSLEELALKALAVNISDIAAMGGKPLYFYLGLGLPKDFSTDSMFMFFKGLKQGCKKWNIELAGGDYSISSTMVISITMVGESINPIYRNNAQDGDLIAITGPTGESAIGLQLLLKGFHHDYFIKKHKTVDPEIDAGVILSSYANSMIDISDGLLIDINRILLASQKGATIHYEKIPVSKQIKSTCKKYQLNEYEVVLAGGEDYILLFTISQSNLLKLKYKYPHFTHFIIGEIFQHPTKLYVLHNQTPIQLPQKGYDHFTQK